MRLVLDKTFDLILYRTKKTYGIILSTITLVSDIINQIYFNNGYRDFCTGISFWSVEMFLAWKLFLHSNQKQNIRMYFGRAYTLDLIKLITILYFSVC